MRVSYSSAAFLILTAVLAAAMGASTTVSPAVPLMMLAAAIGVMALGAPAAYWVAAAVSISLLSRGLSNAGALPAVTTFLDLPLTWGALVVAAAKRRSGGAFVTRHMAWMLVFAATTFAAAIVSPTELLRPVVYLALIAQPFALIAALVLDPPNERQRRVLVLTLVGLLAVQLPIAYAQFAAKGFGDGVQGTLYGTGAGAHVLSAIMVVGAAWVLASRERLPALRRYAIAAALLAIPFLADAKQVVFALPALLLVGHWQSARTQLLVGCIVVGSIVMLVMIPTLNQGYGIRYLQETRSGQSGKLLAAQYLMKEFRADPPSIVFGKGPASTVSRAAFQTTELHLKRNSPLRKLQLKEAPLATKIQNQVGRLTGGSWESYNSALSSALGVFGDLGIVGAIAYAGLFFCVFRELRRRYVPEASGAVAGFALMLALGFIYDWWEEPPFTLFVAALAGLALAARAVAGDDAPESLADGEPVDARRPYGYRQAL